MIIDSHAHLGYDEVADMGVHEDDLLAAYEQYGIDGAIVQPLICRPYLDDTRQIHDRIFRFCQNHPGKYWGMVSMNPHFRPEDYDEEAKRCVSELGFVGIKIATSAHGINPAKKNGMHVFEVAGKLNVPVMVHTGSGTPLSDPMNLLPAARAFPEVKIILAHGGSDLMTQQVIFLASEYENVFVEPSWLNILAVGGMLKILGPGKIMFSSDMPANIPVELAKYRSLTGDQAVLEQMLSGTVINVFGLQVKS
jgi:uncharacterized protein